MNSKIALCDCKHAIGVYSDNGLIIGDIILKYFEAICCNCGNSLIYKKGYLVSVPNENLNKEIIK